MKPAKDPLVVAIKGLQDALAQSTPSAPQKTSLMDRALENVELAIRKHAAISGPVGEPVVDVDSPLLPSPGVDRRKAELRSELAALLRETHSLRKELQDAPSQGILAPEGTCLAGPQPDHGGNLQEYFVRAQQLAAALETFNKDDVHFVQDTVTTDIGGGD